MQRITLIIAIALIAHTTSAQIFINEIMARNDYSLADENGEFDDWIEIYNPTNSDVDLAGGYFTDDLSNTTLHQIESGFPDLTTVPANGYLIFWADGTPEQGANHLGMSLRGGGESVALVASDGEFVINAFQFDDQENDISYGRVSDGSIDFQYFTIPTPNASNQDIIPEAQTLYINEILVENTSVINDETGMYEPWIEIYNPNDLQVNLAGYTLDFNDGQTSYLIENTDPNATVVENDNHRLFWCDGQSIEGILHTNFELENSGVIKLIGPDGVTVVDEVSYSSPGENTSYGREMDGSESFVDFNIPTPDVTNQLLIVQPEELYINEIMASNVSDVTDNYEEQEDWVEIYNPNNFPVNLSGYHLSDNIGGGSWEVPSTFPDSVTVPAGGFLLFWADNDEEQGVRHTNFKLSVSGEEIVLLSTDNFTVADSKVFPVQSDDVSWGREEDGLDSWVYFIPGDTTPASSNQGGEDNVLEFESSELLIYPNPATDIIQLEKQVKHFQIYTIEGRLVTDVKNINKLDVSSLETGVYVVWVNGVTKAQLVKL